MNKLATCARCGTTGLTWNQSVKGKWYLGVPNLHTFEDGNQVATHIKAHDCNPTPEQLEAFEAQREEREAIKAAKLAAEEAIRARIAARHWVPGEEGDFVELSGTVIASFTISTKFGNSQVIVIETEALEVAKIFTTANWAWSVSEDDSLTISGYIGSHDIYNEEQQTLIKRPKLINHTEAN